MKKTRRNEAASTYSIEGRLEAIIALLAPIMRGSAKSDSVVESAEEKAVLALDRAGVPQLQIANLLGVSNNRVNDLLKKKRKASAATPATDGQSKAKVNNPAP